MHIARRTGLLLALWSTLGHGAIAASLAGTPQPAAACPTWRAEKDASPLERDLLAAATAGWFENFTLFDAAVIASGVETQDSLAHYQKILAALVDRAKRSRRIGGTERQKAEAIFGFLHNEVLVGGYCLQATDLRETLDHGRFNCVSATVLFNVIARRFGLRAEGLAIPGHVLSRIRLPDGTLDVETTCPRWFQIIDDPEERTALIERTLGHIGAQNYRNPRAVTDVEMVAMIYYNRGIDLLAAKKFALAAAANGKSLRLDPANATARGNLMATINNWAIDLGASQRYPEAAELFKTGMKLDPGYATFRLNYIFLFRQWTERLCSAGQFDEAIRLLTRAALDQPDEPYFARAQSEIYRRWASASRD